MRVRVLVATIVTLVVVGGIATAHAGDAVAPPQWVLDRQVAYTVHCPRQVASSLANLDWDREQRVEAQRVVTQTPEKAAEYGSLAWQRYWVRVGDQTHRLLEQLCR